MEEHPMTELTRRSFTHHTLGSLLTYSLLDTLAGADLFADEVKPVTVKWLADVNQLGSDAKGQKLKQVEWQKKIEELFAKVDLPDLLRLIDFDRLAAGVQLVDKGERSLKVKFPEIEGLPTNLVFGRQVFALKKGRSVVPHGHNNMATAFLILKGDFHGRHYKPTIDREFQPGGCSTISDHKDNIHWFQALNEPAFIFNIHVTDIVSSSAKPTGRVYLDPNGEKLKDGLVRAKRLSYQTAYDLYG
jgi:hypothetical protein